MNDFYLIFKNLVRKPLRLFLTTFAIFIAFMIHAVLGSFMGAFDAGVELAADDRLITVNKINFTQPLPVSYYNKIRAVKGVAEAAHLNWFGGYYQDPQNQVMTFAVSEDTLLDVYSDLVIPDDQAKNWKMNRRGLLVGEMQAKAQGWKVGDTIPLNSNIFSKDDGSSTWDFVIEGIYKGTSPQVDTNSVYMHYDYYNETKSFDADYLGFIGIKTIDPAVNEYVIKTIDDMFVNSPYETETVPEKVFNAGFVEQIGDISLILSSVIFAAFFIILVIVGNSMVLAIRERTREIGVMKTLGFESPRIFKMVLAESLMLSFLGGLLGLGVAYMLLHFVVNQLPMPLPDLIITPLLAAKALGIMAFLGFVTGIIPAFNALRLNIITAMKS
ncbi:ABC transporter permease [Kordiimonas pumila]|uniref:ABC transporter permease n=1 Tax=Kordiimonas pumila TaxID=2161677 RepID=A0ABV7D952_9PROT|nr:ABC transporter permease [Kordiimonas pumila]